MRTPKTIGFVGDIHCGSRVGLWPLNDLPGDGPKYLGIRYLMSCWRKLIASMPQLDLLFLMGDLIDGKQPKSKGVGILTADLGEQVDAAIDVLRPLTDKARRVVRVWGTPYHESHDSILGKLDYELSVTLADQVVYIDLGIGVLNVAHHPSSGGVLYRGTAVDKESLWSMVACEASKTPRVRWIVRGHTHEYFYQENEARSVCLVPCFQLATAHAKKVNYWRWQPSIGGVCMYRDRLATTGFTTVGMTFPSLMPEVKQWAEVSARGRRRAA